MVLLKNNGVLPLDLSSKKLLIIGPFAKTPRYQGSGSSKINPTMKDTLADILKTEYPFIDFEIYDDFSSVLTETGELTETVDAMLRDICHVIVMAGLPDVMESEGFDRTTLHLPETQNKVIDRLTKKRSDVIVCLSNGAPVTMPWIDQVGAVLETYLGGQAQAGATADLLFGKISPSGRLAETFYLDNKDCLADSNFPGHRMQVVYHESIFVGYRQTTSMNTPVLFPFGFGLSYATFEYKDLKVKETQSGFNVTVLVTNTSLISAKEVIQVYLEPKNSKITKPKRTLAQFAKVSLDANETKEVMLEIPMEAFMHFDLAKKQLVTEGGITHVQIAKNAHEILLETPITLPEDPDSSAIDPYPDDLSDLLEPAVFERLLEAPIPTPDTVFPYTVMSPLEDLKYRVLGRLILSIVDRTLKKRMTSSTDAVDLKMIDETKRSLPLKSLTSFAGIPPHQVKGLIHMLNHNYLKALWTLMTKKG
jgi:beta-glucosidase